MSFLKYFFQDILQVFEPLWNMVLEFFTFFRNLFDFKARINGAKAFNNPPFKPIDWVLLIIAYLLFIIILGLIIFFMVKGIKRLLRFRLPIKENEKLKEDVRKLTREVYKLNYEKDKILAMKVAELGLPADQLLDGMEDDEEKTEDDGELLNSGNRNTVDSPPVAPEKSRFFRLTTVDNYYKMSYEEPEYDNEITLEQFCDRWRDFAASKLRLYYDVSILRYFVASLGASRLIILQGISGTGKTSLPYSLGKFLQLDTTVAAVQPAWRDRTELFGYFNEFTKMFNETEFLRAVYEANYFKDPHVIILDEMNIARVEYYFAEMLSVLEMPRPEEWLVNIVTTEWDNDPCLINGGKIHVNNNTWFVGTINNDDSTFAVADKVYDRAIPIDLDSKAPSFVAPETDPVHVTAAHLAEMFADAKQKYPLSAEMLKKLDEMDAYVIKHFRLAFGNRIMKQIRDFVPCYVACGGTEIDGIDFIVAKKILRKFESLNMGFVKDELHKFVIYLDKNFGRQNMQICKEYLERMQKMS